MDRLVGPRGRHNPERVAVRHGTQPGQVTLGGRRVRVDRPRVRRADGAGELPLPTWQAFAGTQLLDQLAVKRMLAMSRLGRPGEAERLESIITRWLPVMAARVIPWTARLRPLADAVIALPDDQARADLAMATFDALSSPQELACRWVADLASATDERPPAAGVGSLVPLVAGRLERLVGPPEPQAVVPGGLAFVEAASALSMAFQAVGAVDLATAWFARGLSSARGLGTWERAEGFRQLLVRSRLEGPARTAIEDEVLGAVGTAADERQRLQLAAWLGWGGTDPEVIRDFVELVASAQLPILVASQLEGLDALLSRVEEPEPTAMHCIASFAGGYPADHFSFVLARSLEEVAKRRRTLAPELLDLTSAELGGP